MNKLESHQNRREESKRVQAENPENLDIKKPITFYIGAAKTTIYVTLGKYKEFGEDYFIQKYKDLRKTNVIIR